MKRTLIFALVALVMVVFASCGKKETKQFQAQKEAIKEIEALIDKADNCDDLTYAAFGFWTLTSDVNEYAENEKMTADEEKQIEKMVEDLTNKMEEKSQQMDCANQEPSEEFNEFFDEIIEEGEEGGPVE